jgi:glycosyltransferase involved in cell wall biosynthesis
MQPPCPDLSAVVLTYNEEANIRACLESVRGLCEIFVVDSGSTDRTRTICAEYTSNIVVHPYANHARQWDWALRELPISTDWVLALDADFTVTPQLADRLRSDLRGLAPEIDGIYVRHLYVFGGNLIRFGGTKQHWMRIVRRDRARPDLSDLVDFRFVCDREVVRWPEAVLEYNRHDDDISTWNGKQDKFSLRLAVEEELRRSGRIRWEVLPAFWGHADQRFAWLRDRWLRLPLFVRPVAYFLYRYLLAGGFLDGKGGFLYHLLQGLWLRLMVDWKLQQLRAKRLTTEQLEQLATRMLTVRSGSVEQLVRETLSEADPAKNHVANE